VLFGTLALTMFLGFHAIASGRPSLPFILLLICVATIPVIVMIAPAQAEAFPKSMVRGMAVAVLMIGIVYLPWPHAPMPAPAPAPEARPVTTAPVVQALASTAVVMPLMLVYLMLGLADALPVIITTTLLVITFDVQRGRQQAMAMILGNLVGGVLGLVLHTMLLVAPNLVVLAALLFVVLLAFGQRIFSGSPTAPVAVITCNSMLIILSLTIVSEGASLSVWITRMFQFTLAGAFAVGMMSLISPRTSVQPATQ